MAILFSGSNVQESAIRPDTQGIHSKPPNQQPRLFSKVFTNLSFSHVELQLQSSKPTKLLVARPCPLEPSHFVPAIDLMQQVPPLCSSFKLKNEPSICSTVTLSAGHAFLLEMFQLSH